MATQFDSVSVTLSTSVGFGGTFTADYPTGRTAEDYRGGTAHRIHSQAYRSLYAANGEFTVAFGASEITVSMAVGLSLANGTVLTLELDRAERDDPAGEALADAGTMTTLTPVKIYLGAPDAADVDGILAAYTGSAPALDGALVSDDVATFDVPRNIVIDSGGADTAVLTFTGTDAYGATVVESITLNGTTAVAGKKAFKTVTGVTSSAAIANGAFAGPGDVFGLPVYLADVADVVKEIEDGAAATAGTLVAGVGDTATATTGDVRGTYDPNSAADGTKVFELIAMVRSTSYKGATQFSG